MKTLGLDIGTTSISAVVYDPAQGVLETYAEKNDTFLPGQIWERIQDPNKIWKICLSILKKALDSHGDLSAIGVTGQMHGIVYLDGSGEPVSPLYTWQDGRGDLPYDTQHSWASYLSTVTSHPLSSGYGMVTHFYNVCNHLVPETAVTFCTIQDFAAMKLAGRTRPAMEATNAASLGLYDAVNGCFDDAALSAAQIDTTLLPSIAKNMYLGNRMFGIPVYTAIGDNQASFLGATEERRDALLVNMGTGGQVCVYSPVYLQTDTLETRPFPDGGWLLVGASLCGGRSYALLEKFFRETVKMATGSEIDVYPAMMDALDSSEIPLSPPTAITTFQGTRKDPALRGAFLNISEENFTPLHFIYSVMQGMAEELFSLYRGYLEKGGAAPGIMIGSGNGFRKNAHLCSVFEKTFGYRMILSGNDEEAACGAAMYAAKQAQL